jgi:hypothetical protein
MADAATTGRGLNEIAGNASHTALAKAADQDSLMKMPSGRRDEAPIFGDISSKALFFANGARTAATGKLTEGNRSGVYSLTGDSWVAVDWDPEVQAFDLTPIPASSTDGIEWTSDPAAAANAGMEIPASTTKRFVVADAPLGRIYIRRTNATNSGNGSVTVKVNHIAYGSRNMLGASRRNVDTAHN